MNPEKENLEKDQFEENQEKISKYDELKDNLILNDLEIFYKTGKLPYIFFFHILSTLIITVIILKTDKNSNNLMQQARSIQSAFYFFHETNDPNDNYPRTYYFTTLPNLMEHIEQLINTTFNINEKLAYNINYKNESNLKIQFTYRKNVQHLNNKTNESLPYSIEILNNKTNPIKEYFNYNYTKIRTFLSLTKEISIELKYEYDRLTDDVCQEVSIILSYDTSRIAKIGFTPLFYFDNCPNKLTTKDVIKKGFTNSNSFLCIILIIFSICQIITLSHKFLLIFKIILYIQKKIKNIDLLEKLSIENIYASSGNDLWDVISIKDVLSLFPKFLIFILISSIFNFLGGMSYIIIPFLNNINQLLFGFSSIISYISIAYYFQSDKNYYLFYNTLSKSTKEYKGLLITFMLLFSGFTLLHIIIFCNSDKWYDGFQGGFLTLFAATLGDLLLNIWSSTLEAHPIITLILGFTLFVVFLGNHIRVMFTMTQESFQIANLENNRSWLDNKFDFRDYLKQEFNYDNRNEEKEKNKDDKNFVVDDVWMRAIINKDDSNKLENIDFSKLKVKGYNVEAIINYLKDIRNLAKRKKLSKMMFEEILYDEDKSDIIKIANKNDEIKSIFGNLNHIFDKIKKISKMDDEKLHGVIREICENNLETLGEIKNLLKNKNNNEVNIHEE